MRRPWGIMIAVLLLDARRGQGIVWTYVVAWVCAITFVLTVLLAGFGTVFESGSDSATTATSLAELVLGVALLALGLKRVLQSRRAAARQHAPASLRRRRRRQDGYARSRTSPMSPRSCAAFLDRMRVWLTLHSRAVITMILLVFGVTIIARGLSGLG